MSHWFLAAQIMGVLLFVFETVANVQKHRNNILMCGAIAKMFETLQYVLLFAWTGAFFGLFKLARYVLFYWLHKNNKTPSKILFALLTLMVCALGIATWDNYLSLIVIAATLISLFATWQGVAKNIRVAFIMANILLAAYAFAVMAYAGAVAYLVQAMLLGVSVYRFDMRGAVGEKDPS